MRWQDAGLSKGIGRHQSKCGLCGPSRRKWQRNFSRRASGNLLPYDLSAFQQPVAGLASGRPTQARPELDYARSKHGNPAQLSPGIHLQ